MMATHRTSTDGTARPAEESRGEIVVGVDGSDSSIAALRLAAELGDRLDVEVHALGVWNHPTLLYGNYYYPDSDITPEQDAHRVVEATLQAAFGESVPERVTAGTQQGRPAEVLIDRSNGARMLALGTRGHGGFAGLLLGSVSAECTAHAHCPVLVVHETGDGRR